VWTDHLKADFREMDCQDIDWIRLSFVWSNSDLYIIFILLPIHSMNIHCSILLYKTQKKLISLPYPVFNELITAFENGGMNPYFHWGEQSHSHPGRSYSEYRILGTHWIKDSVGSRASLYPVEDRKCFCACCESNPAACLYTDWAIPAFSLFLT
jgi:hypothetical protein